MNHRSGQTLFFLEVVSIMMQSLIIPASSVLCVSRIIQMAYLLSVKAFED